MSQQFDDSRLISLAKTFYYTKGNEPSKVVREALTKEKLSNDERNALIEFIQANSFNRPMSMGEMKREILAYIGYSDAPRNYSYNTSTVSSKEMTAIYHWFKKQMGKAVDAKNKD